MRTLLFVLLLQMSAISISAQTPKIEPGVPLELAKWRAEHYSDIRYELNLTIEKMAPTLKGKLAVELAVRSPKSEVGGEDRRRETGDRSERTTNFSLSRLGPDTRDSSLITRYSSLPIILDWRRISGHEKLSQVSNVTINGKPAEYEEVNEHLVFRKGVVEGKNRIELEFESPILTSGSAITRYVDKEDGSEYIYSLFVPSDASTAFPVFDQPDLKARFKLKVVSTACGWQFVSNSTVISNSIMASGPNSVCLRIFAETKPISTYVFAFAAGPFEVLEETGDRRQETGIGTRSGSDGQDTSQKSEVGNQKLVNSGFDLTHSDLTYRNSPAGATDVSPGWSRRRNPGNSGNKISEPRSGDRNAEVRSLESEVRTPIRIFVRKSQAHKLLPPPAADAGKGARAPVSETDAGKGARAPVSETDAGNGARAPVSETDAGKGARAPVSETDAGKPAAKRLTADRSPLTPAARAPVEEVFRLNRESLEYLEDYFDYPFPFPKYDVVLIPEFPFGGMEHAGATFLRETSVIFPTEPTANNYISRATLIFHEAAHQWFGDTVTMKWFDDLWLKEGFATFMAHKTMEKVLPEYDSWKVFYQRVKPTAYATDVTKGTVPIYQDIPNLNSAKSAYGAIVYQKAPSFLRQAEFYLGEDKFKQSVRSFLKKNEFANAEWSDLVGAFEKSSKSDLTSWADVWVKKRSLPVVRLERNELREYPELGKPHDTALIYSLEQEDALGEGGFWPVATEVLQRFEDGREEITKVTLTRSGRPDKIGFAKYWTHLVENPDHKADLPVLVFPNYRDYGYGIFLLDEKSRDYILKNIRDEKDEFLRAQMWGSLWDSVRFAELAPLDYIDLAIANVDNEKDETTISSILGRTAYANTYYLSDKQQAEVAPKLEGLLIDKMHSAPTVGQRITYYRALLGVAKGEEARAALKELFQTGGKRRETGDGGRETGIGTRSGSDGQSRSQKSEVGEHEIADANSGKRLPRRGEMPVAPGGAEGGTRSKDANMILSRFSGDMEAGKPAAKPLTAYRPPLTGPAEPPFPIRPKDRFDIATRLIEIGDPDGAKFLAELEKTEKDDAALRWAYAAKAGFATKENKEKFWKDFTQNTELSESWIEEAFGVWNSPAHSELTLPYLERALAELPKLKRNRKIFFVNGWLGAFIGGQKSREALDIVHAFLEKNPDLDADLRRKILENVDGLERAVNIRSRFGR